MKWKTKKGILYVFDAKVDTIYQLTRQIFLTSKTSKILFPVIIIYNKNFHDKQIDATLLIAIWGNLH